MNATEAPVSEIGCADRDQRGRGLDPRCKPQLRGLFRYPIESSRGRISTGLHLPSVPASVGGVNSRRLRREQATYTPFSFSPLNPPDLSQQCDNTYIHTIALNLLPVHQVGRKLSPDPQFIVRASNDQAERSLLRMKLWEKFANSESSHPPIPLDRLDTRYRVVAG